MYDYDVGIDRVENGYIVCVKDPAITKANQKAGINKPYKDPKREYAFKTVDEVLAWLKANLDKALPADEYESAFDEAAGEDEEE